MAEKLYQQLKELGSKLQNLPITKDALVKLLKQASACLTELDQSSSKSVLDFMNPFSSAIVRPELLKSPDLDVKLLVAMCICEIIRITAPEAPYEDNVLKDIFPLVVSIFNGLNEINGPSFGRRAVILENLAKYKSCVMMLDLGCDDLVKEMFSIFFSIVRENHPQNVLTSMERIMSLLLEESDDVPEDILLTLLSNLGRNGSDVIIAARKLAMNVIKQCSTKVEPGIKKFLVAEMSRENGSLLHEIDYHDVIYDIYCCSPLVLSGIIPYLTEELLEDQLDIRLKATRLVGDLFALTGFDDLEVYQPLLSEFLRRLTDKAVEIRMIVLEKAKIYLLSSPFRSQVSLIISSICERLLDYDENVRKLVVSVVSDVACHRPSSITVETVRLVADRLRDKSLPVRKYTMDRLGEMHKIFCSDGRIKSGEFDWIPGVILKCLYDKDFRSDTVESVLCGSLFPTKFPIRDIVDRWVRAFSGFEKVEVKALEKILEQKQRLQQEMQKYLSLRQLNQNSDVLDFQRKVQISFRIMSGAFTDPVNAEEKFRILHHLEDAKIWKYLTALLDPDSGFYQVLRCQDDLLKVLGEKHSVYGFVSALSIKCSYILFNKEHVRELLLQASGHRHTANAVLMMSCMNLLVVIARFSPVLFRGNEGGLLELLNDENEVIRDGMLHVLARAGGSIREQLGASLNSIELLFERICEEGSRRQAKYAVYALAAMTEDDGLRSLSVLYKRLVDILDKKAHLPAVLQSLGCIAQTAMPVFETREAEVEEFIITKILRCSSKTIGIEEGNWDARSKLCSLKIFGIKTLVKSFMPFKDAHVRIGVEKFLKILKDILSFGEISNDVESSCVDKAHLRLACAKAVIRLARHWDNKISVDIFYSTLWGVDANFPVAKRFFLRKVHQYIKGRVLDAKYACAFLFDTIISEKPQFGENQHNLHDVIQMCQQMKTRKIFFSCDTSAQMAYPECILSYVVHALSHFSLCPAVEKCEDIKASDPTYRRLHMFLSVLMHVDEDVSSEATSRAKEIASTAISILQSIKCSEDVVDASKSKNSYAICDLGISIIKSLSSEVGNLCGRPPSFCLPPELYRNLQADDAKETLAVQQKTGLADIRAVKRFEISSTELNMNKDTCMRNHRVENEVSLGEILEHVKFEGAANNVTKFSPTRGRNSDSGIGNFEKSGTLEELEFRGSESLTLISKRVKNNNHEMNYHKWVDSEKWKSDSCLVYSSMSKRQRTSATQDPFRFSISVAIPDVENESSIVSPETDLKMERVDIGLLNEMLDQPTTSCALASERHTDSSFPSRDGVNCASDIIDGKANFTREKADVLTRAGSSSTSSRCKPLTSSNKNPNNKRKRKSVAELLKCNSKVVGKSAINLVGRRIKVWWPLDKQFYNGVIKSYDRAKRKHVVLYDDGDVEVLRLDRERWELIDTSQPTKKLDYVKDGIKKTIISGKRTPTKRSKTDKIEASDNEPLNMWRYRIKYARTGCSKFAVQ